MWDSKEHIISDDGVRSPPKREITRADAGLACESSGVEHLAKHNAEDSVWRWTAMRHGLRTGRRAPACAREADENHDGGGTAHVNLLESQLGVFLWYNAHGGPPATAHQRS